MVSRSRARDILPDRDQRAVTVPGLRVKQPAIAVQVFPAQTMCVQSPAENPDPSHFILIIRLSYLVMARAG